MAHRINNPNSSADKAIRAIDRQREQERRYMLEECFKQADDLATKLVQRLLDQHIIETTSENELRELFTKLLRQLSEMEEFDIQFKISPIRGLANDPNFVSLYLTQYIVEDLLDHPKIQEVFGADIDVYNAVNSVMIRVRPPK